MSTQESRYHVVAKKLLLQFNKIGVGLSVSKMKRRKVFRGFNNCCVSVFYCLLVVVVVVVVVVVALFSCFLVLI